METKEMSFVDVVFSWGTSIFVLFAIILTIIGYVNGYIGSFKEIATEFFFNLISALIYIIIRMIPSIDQRPPFYPQKK